MEGLNNKVKLVTRKSYGFRTAKVVRFGSAARPGTAPRAETHPRILPRSQKRDDTGGQREQALGRGRGGFGTKIHGAVSGLGLSVQSILTPGQAPDMSPVKALIEGSPVEVGIADKGHVSRAVVEAVEAKGAEAVIPSLKNRAELEQRDYDRSKDRNLVEQFWLKAKPYRRVATRYEKTARNFLAFVDVASIMIMLR